MPQPWKPAPALKASFALHGAAALGTLALSSVPVLHAVGVTVGPGALLALLLSAVFASREVPA